MIDLHCHIIPGVDDGVQTMEESLALARLAVKEGIETVVAAPHHLHSTFRNPKSSIIKKVSELNKELKNEGIPLEVLPGQEVRLNGDILNAFKREEVLAINHTSGHVYIEFPNHEVPTYTNRVFYDIQMEGYKPVITHPETNRTFRQNPDLLYQLVKNGAITQVTAASFVGKNGKAAKKFAFQLIESSLTHIVASNAHSKKRGFYLADAYEKIEKKFGSSTVYQFMENAHVVLDGEMVYTDRPSPMKSNKILGIF
ncbi:tyrosine-protein phosphatase [Halobacillus yeomjeoni]|uniref:Tyrosine-protein phosphatase n=1 Tax=Halobacillus yeomjeoni TaxID=311194 RepID=A0A931HWP2_9BACI|nr:CpsB/CapC family capsule biosynthesis tyrosine phosphatase [Halobacillus yeomjeoni]MBH0230813.1 tyrosine protein phosphatase [Halobacillus yeomjeoni]